MVSTPGTVLYPTALDDADSLIRAANNAASALATSLLAADTTAALTSGAALPASGLVTLLTGEILYYTGKSGDTLTGLVRGREGTAAAASAPAGTGVEQRRTARHHTVLADAIIATQTKLGVGASAPVAGAYLRGGATPGTSSWSALLQADVLAALGYTPQDAASAATDTELGVVAVAAAAAQATANTGVANAATAQATANTALANAATANAQLGGTAAAGTLLVGTGAGAAAWQATSALSFVGGQLGINRAAPGAMLHAVASGAAVIGEIVQGAASQTANLTEWRDSSGTVLASVGSGGRINARTDVNTGIALSAASPWATLNVSLDVAAGIAISHGGTQIIYAKSAFTTLAQAVGINTTTGLATNATFSVKALLGSTPTVVVQAVAGATGNMTQWQNSTATVLASIDANGNLNTSGNAVGTSGSSYGAYVDPIQTAITTGNIIGVAARVRTTAAMTVAQRGTAIRALTPFPGAGGTIAEAVGVEIQSQAGTGVSASYGLLILGGSSYSILSTGYHQFNTGAAAAVGMVIRGAASQTANLQEWQNSSGTLLSAVNAAGGFGIGVAPSASYGLLLSPPAGGNGIAVSGNLTSASGGTGIFSDVLQTTNTSIFHAVLARVRTSATAITATQASAFHVSIPVVGATSTISALHGLYVSNQGAAGVTTVYGIRVAAQSGAGTNLALATEGGTVRFASTGNKLEINDTGIGFFAATPTAKPSITGSRGGNAAVAALLTALATMGLLTDSTTA